MRTLIEGSDYCVRVINFPNATIGAAVIEDADGFYSIYLNARMPREAQRRSFYHEIRHLENDDFHNGKPIRDIERRSIWT